MRFSIHLQFTYKECVELSLKQMLLGVDAIALFGIARFIAVLEFIKLMFAELISD